MGAPQTRLVRTRGPQAKRDLGRGPHGRSSQHERGSHSPYVSLEVASGAVICRLAEAALAHFRGEGASGVGPSSPIVTSDDAPENNNSFFFASQLMIARLERSSTPRRSSRVSEDLWRIEDSSAHSGLGDDARAPHHMPGLRCGSIYLCMARLVAAARTRTDRL